MFEKYNPTATDALEFAERLLEMNNPTAAMIHVERFFVPEVTDRMGSSELVRLSKVRQAISPMMMKR